MRNILLLILLTSWSNLHSQTQIGSPFITTNENEWIGWDIDINNDGNVIAISSIAYPNYDSPNGVVRLFKRNDSEWEQIGEDIITQDANNGFGYSIALSENGSILAIGSPSQDVPYTGCGAVSIYEIVDENEIVNSGIIQGNESYQGIGFSIDLSYDGNSLVIGNQDPEYGIVQVYEKQNGGWQLKGNQIISDVYGDKFGFNVMIDSSGNLISAISPSIGVLTGEMPNIKVFNYINDDWQVNNDIITSPNFDNAVQYFVINKIGSLIAVKKKESSYGGINFYTIQNNQIEQSPESISGEADFNLNNESNIISFADNGQAIAIEGSNKIKLYKNNNDNWNEQGILIESEKVIHNMKISENGEYVIVSFTGVNYSDREVIVYRLEGILNSFLEQNNAEIELYPNPVHINLQVELEEFNFMVFEIDSGRTVKSGYSIDGEINVIDLNSGGYILSIEKDGKTKILKFIKQE